MEEDIEEGGFDMGEEEKGEMYGELDSLFAEFLESELSNPQSELSQIYGELAAEDIVSDYNMKLVKQLANKGSALTPNEVWFLSTMAGKDEDGFDPRSSYSDSDDGGVTEAQLEKYAEHIRNYLYTYKDEARDIDPSIDPKEEHVGPMAQDIEKVAPDCVKETVGGVKTVDGERLALVNAGVIGELSRRLLDLEAKVNGTANG